MAITTQAQWKLDIDRDINTNGQQRITGAITNARLTDLSDSVLWGELRTARNVAVAAVGSTVNFQQPMRGNTYVLLIRCYNATGEAIGYEVDPSRTTVSGFNIIPAQDGFIDYIALR